jgi:hypothetical protein
MKAVLSAGGSRPRAWRRGWAAVACLGLAMAGVSAAPASAASQTPSGCAPAAVGQLSCGALVAPGSTAVPASQVRPASAAAAASLPPGLGPLSLRAAYGLADSALTGGVGQTVAVVTEYGDPTAQADMAAYRTDYSLPPCGTGCFSEVDENGGTNYPPEGPAGWTEATADSLDMISAICPNCHILLVEAGVTSNGSTTAGISDVGVAENTAVSLGAKFVTNTWFTPEATFATSEPAYDSEYFDHPGVAITAPDGDSAGYGTYYPAASPDVIAVGGTTLTQDTSAARGWTETAFSSSGSGCSPYEAKPSWQTDTGCSTRMLNDVAAVADPSSHVATYDTTGGGWLESGGGDIASAIVAAAFALAGTPAAGGNPASYLYGHDGANLVSDITTGSDGTCTPAPAYFCTAGTGYDGPTGVGTIASATALGAHAPDASLTGAPAVVDPATGSLDVFGTGTQNGTAWGDIWTAAKGWAGWQNLGGDMAGKPMSALYDPATGNIEVYALSSKGDVEEDYSGDGTTWSGWKDLGGTFGGAPSAVFNPLTGSVDVWEVATSDTALVDSGKPGSGWSGWQNKSGLFSQAGLDAVYDPVHRTMQVYGVGNENGTVWGGSYTSATGSFSGWTNMDGNLTGVLSAIYDPLDGNIEVYGQDTSASSDYTEETDSADPASGWSGWHYLSGNGPVLSHPPVAVYNPLGSSVEVWEAEGGSETAFDDSWTSSGGWTSWQNRSGYIISGIDPVYDLNSGDLRAFGVGPQNGTVWDATMDPSGSVSSWANIDGILQSGDF